MAYLSCTVSGNVIAGRAQDQPEGCESCHQCKTNRAVPEVQNFRERHVSCCSHDTGHDGDNRDQGMRFEVAGDVG